MPEQLSELKQPILECRQVSKIFPGVIANDKVNFNCRRGEVHTLLGENGAGKSTLMNILSGLYPPDGGEIILHGKRVHFSNPSQAIQNGIGMVHQHFMLIQNHTVAENIILGTPQRFNLNLSRICHQIRDLGEKYNLIVDPYKKIQELTVGEQQRVEILKVLYKGAKILILDEPTAVLTPQESEALYKIIRKMLEEQYTIIFISHKMKEVMLLSDRITILSKGKAIATLKRGEATINQLASMMMGEASRKENNIEESLQPVKKIEKSNEKPALDIRGICADDWLGNQILHDINMQIFEGEIVGLAGVSGNGQVALAEVLSGMLSFTKGTYEFYGETIKRADVIKMSKLGVGYIPEDRKKFGIVDRMSISHNFLMRDYTNSDFYNKLTLLQSQKISEYTKSKMKEFDIRAASEKSPVGTLSGGNIQKMILARELSRYLRFLLACQPIRGLDINASNFIHKTILKAKAAGLAVLLISEDLDELLHMSDRLYVICGGKIVGSLLKEEADIEKIGLMMTGVEASSQGNPN